MAHFLKPTGRGNEGGYVQRSDGVLTSVKIAGKGATKVVTLWGGGRGGEVLQMWAALDAHGRVIANVVPKSRKWEWHKDDPDGDHKWYFQYTLVGERQGTGTLTVVDSSQMPFARLQVTVGGGDIKVTLADGVAETFATKVASNVVTPPSLLRIKTGDRKQKMTTAGISAGVMLLRYKIEKNGSTFWMCACVPQDVKTFTKAYLYFHPNTLNHAKDDPSYSSFGARWRKLESDYVRHIGVQVAAGSKLVLLFPCMAANSNANAAANMFSSGGLETINDVLAACAVSAKKSATVGLTSLAVASYSSGVDHMVTFAANLGGSGIIKQLIDLDGPHMKRKVLVPRLRSATGITLTQEPNDRRAPNWLVLDGSVWDQTSQGFPDDDMAVHGNIGMLTMLSVAVNYPLG